ncbi:MAG: hypothetical protein RLZZ204_677 [Bacteroidota bacterium]|jgi:hypothetical protein
MLVKTKSFSFIDKLTIELEETTQGPLHVVLKSEDGKICCKTEKKISNGNNSINWEGLDELPYGVYTVECSQGQDTVRVKTVKRI